MKPSTKSQSLVEFTDRVAYIVTDLNGLISSIVNEEVTLDDFDHDLADLFEKLNEVETVVGKLTEHFWR